MFICFIVTEMTENYLYFSTTHMCQLCVFSVVTVSETNTET